MSTHAFTRCMLRILLLLVSIEYLPSTAVAQRSPTTEEQALDYSKEDTEQLITLLNSPRYAQRQEATRCLHERGFENLDRLLQVCKDGSCEQRLRSESVLDTLSHRLKLEILSIRSEVAVEVTNPRYWDGENQLLNGAYDQSLDSTLKLTLDPKVKKVLSPLLIRSAKSDSGEALNTQVWARSWGSSGQAQLYLNRPTRYFKSVEVNALIHCCSEIDDSGRLPLAIGTHSLREGVTWIEVKRQVESSNDTAGRVITVYDKLGRLCAENTRLHWLSDKRQFIDELETASRYRRVYFLPESDIVLDKEPAFVSIECKSGPVVVTREVNFTVLRPEEKPIHAPQ